MMKKAILQMRKYWKINLLVFLISLIVETAIFLLFFFLRGKTLTEAINGTAVGGVTVFFLGLLALVAHLGAFDTFAFGFKQLGGMLFSKDPRKAGTYSDYREEKRIKRDNSTYSFMAMLIAGLIFFIAAGILEIIYHSSM